MKKIIIPLIMMVLLVGVVSAIGLYNTDFITPLTYIKFDGSVVDEMGYQDFNASGSCGYSSDSLFAGNVYNCTGGVNTNHQHYLNQSIAICFWNRAVTIGNWDTFFASACTYTNSFHYVPAQDHSYYQIGTGGQTGIKGDGTTNMAGGWWNHICMVSRGGEGASKLSVYLNATEIINQTDSTLNVGHVQPTCTLGMGGRWNGAAFDTVMDKGQWDEVLIFNRSLNDTEVNAIYTGVFYGLPVGGNVSIINVTITTPSNDTGFGINNITEIGHNIWINVTRNQSNASCYANDTDWSVISNTSTEYFLLNNTALADEKYTITINCNDSQLYNGTDSVRFTVDLTNPIIIPMYMLSQNRTVVYNGTLSTQINFTDNLEIYSIGVQFKNATDIYNATNLGTDHHELNISVGVDNTISNSIICRVCDAHTSKKIKDADRIDFELAGIKYVIKDNPLIQLDEWVHIYPKEYWNYDQAESIKHIDSYMQTFNKNSKPKEIETFVIESSHYIDIIESQQYGGHVVIKDIGDKGWWADLENNESTIFNIRRINDYKVEVDIYYLKGEKIKVKSVGELNCITEVYEFGNLNPTFKYSNYVLVGNKSEFYFNVSIDPNTMPEVNATLWYNNSYYYVGNESNFSQSITAPLIVSGNSSNVSFRWIARINNIAYNLSLLQQNISNFFIDNCSSYSTRAINYTAYNETALKYISINADGVFTYYAYTDEKTFTLNEDNQNNFSICIFPSYATLYTSYYFHFSASAYPQRRYADWGVLANNTELLNLYGLHSGKGCYAQFKVLDTSENVVSNVNVIAKKSIIGTLRKIEVELSDASGLTTFWINPDSDYTFTFNKTGYAETSFTIRPACTDIYTVILGSGLAAEEQPAGSGIAYKFLPSNVVLQNQTNYTFTFNLTSSYWSVTSCTLYIRNTTTILSSTAGTTTSSTCNAGITYNTDNHTILISEAEYILNLTQNINASYPYTVEYTYTGQFSLKNFLDDLTNFGEAGFDDFTRMIIALIVIIGILVWVASEQEVREPEPLVIVTMALVLLFSFIGWFTLNYPDIPELVFMPAGWLKQYIISILVLMMGGSYLLNKYLS